MRSLRFMVSRKWILFLLIVLLLGYACLLLGQWQWHRLTSTKATNAIIRTNQRTPPAPVDRVLTRGVDPPSSEQYRVVSAVGRYDANRTVIVRYQTRDGASGVDVVVPLVTSSGNALLVDRGWFQTSNQGLTDPSQVPAPPSGQVTVTGWVRQDADGGSAQVVNDSTRAISSAQIEPAIGIPTYGGFVQLLGESPGPATPLRVADPPDLSNGPHFFYSLQWWFFGLLAMFGFGYLAWEEYTGKGARRAANEMVSAVQARIQYNPEDYPEEPSDGAGPAAVDGQHHTGHERRGGAERDGRGTAGH